jgi:hypothetical protein
MFTNKTVLIIAYRRVEIVSGLAPICGPYTEFQQKILAVAATCVF